MKTISVFLSSVCLGIFAGIKISKFKLNKKVSQILKDYKERLLRSIRIAKETDNDFVEIEGTIMYDTAHRVLEELGE